MKLSNLTRVNPLRNLVQKFVKNEAGVTAIEYAIVAAGIAAVVMVIFSNNGVVSETLTNVFKSLSETLTKAVGTGSGGAAS